MDFNNTFAMKTYFLWYLSVMWLKQKSIKLYKQKTKRIYVALIFYVYIH